jgi:hypothetical protein
MRRALSAIIVAAIAAASPVLAKPADTRKPAAAPAARAGKVAPARAQNKTAARNDNEREVAILAALERGSAGTPASFPDSIGWRLIEDPATGARLGVPEKLVPRVGASRMGGRWSSAQGQIQVETFRFTEAALPALFEDEKKASHRQIEASVLRPDLFVIAGAQGLKNFLMRAETRGSEVRGVTVLYDQATEGTMERIALAMIGSYNAFPDPGQPAPPGLRRAVDYGSAIVVTRDGDLLTSARLTDDCRSISVPGVGHAERIAADSATGLALVRAYGARNLAPAALAADGNPSGELRLVGVDDPLAQKGEGAVTSVRAKISGSDIDPAPAPGFAGAAAMDVRGAFAGMIEFKPPVVAAGDEGSTRVAATLVPAEVIRAFLKAHGVSPATGAAAAAGAEQSVVRIICVRK